MPRRSQPLRRDPAMRWAGSARWLLLGVVLSGLMGTFTDLQATTVGKWRRHTISLPNPSYAGNPFELEVDATFTHTASGAALTLPGYYAGGDTWKVGFMPTRTGEWTWITSSADSNLDGKTGSLEAVASTSRGLLASDATHPKKWRYADGPYVVPIGVFVQLMHGAGSRAEIESMADFLAANHLQLVNFRLCEQDICFSDVAARELDLALWDRLEERLEVLAARDLGVDVMLYTDDGGKPSYGARSATERLLVRYMVARLAAFPAVLFNTGIDIWEYRDADWHDWYGGLVRSLDPYGHPVSSRGGTGGVESFMSAGVRTYNSVGTRNSVIGKLLGAFAADDVPAANNDNWGEERTGINGHTPADIRRAAWKATVAGGAGFHVRDNQNNDCANGVTSNCDNPFTVTGLASDLDSAPWLALVDPFVQTRLGGLFGEMVPDPSLVSNGYALADPARRKILYLLMGVNDTWDAGNGGAVTVRLGGLGGSFDATWFDPRTGTESDLGAFAGGADYALAPPSTDDWVLLLTAAGSPTRRLEIAPAPAGGSVSSRPSGIRCPADCGQEFPLGTQVTLHALPDYGSQLDLWDGDPDCSDADLVLLVDTTCSAVFGPCTIASVVDLPAQTVSGAGEFQACNRLTAGTGGFALAADADVVFRAGNLVRLVDRLTIAAGARWRVEIGPPQP